MRYPSYKKNFYLNKKSQFLGFDYLESIANLADAENPRLSRNYIDRITLNLNPNKLKKIVPNGETEPYVTLKVRDAKQAIAALILPESEQRTETISAVLPHIVFPEKLRGYVSRVTYRNEYAAFYQKTDRLQRLEEAVGAYSINSSLKGWLCLLAGIANKHPLPKCAATDCPTMKTLKASVAKVKPETAQKILAQVKVLIPPEELTHIWPPE